MLCAAVLSAAVASATVVTVLCAAVLSAAVASAAVPCAADMQAPEPPEMLVSRSLLLLGVLHLLLGFLGGCLGVLLLLSQQLLTGCLSPLLSSLPVLCLSLPPPLQLRYLHLKQDLLAP